VGTTTVSESALKPDLILTKHGFTKPGFQGFLAIVEFKAPIVSLSLAVAQASKYLNVLSGRGSCDFSHLMHSSLVAIASRLIRPLSWDCARHHNQNAFHPDGNLWNSPQLGSQTYAMQFIKRATAPPKSLRSTIVTSSLPIRS